MRKIYKIRKIRNKNSKIVSLLAIVLLLLLKYEYGTTIITGCEEYNVITELTELDKELQSINWSPLKPGIQLTNFDAILVCTSSSVKLQTDYPFNISYIEWEKESDEKWFLGTLRNNKMVVIRVNDNNSFQPTVRVLDVVGNAYYSKDKAKFHQLNIESLDFSSDVYRKEKQRIEFLNSLSWIPARENMTLQYWSMLRTGKDSFAVLRIEKGKVWIEASELKEEDNKLFIPSNTYLVVNPVFLKSAVILGLKNQVYISNDLEKIQRVLYNEWFFQK